MNTMFVAAFRVAVLLPLLATLPGFTGKCGAAVNPASPAPPPDTAATAPIFDPVPPVLAALMPVLPAELAGVDGQVELFVETNAAGLVTRAEVKSSSRPGLAQPCLDIIKRWRFSPAEREGKPGPALFVLPIHFSTSGVISSVGLKPASIPPEAIERVAPVLPAALEHVAGQTVVAVNLDAHGHITDATVVSSSHEELNGPCLEAVRRWTFSPGIIDGKATASKVQVPFRFVSGPLVAEDVAPARTTKNLGLTPLRQPGLELPDALARVAGGAEIAFVVDQDGYVTAPEVKSATNPAFGELARQTVLTWKFRPATKGGRAVSVRVIQPFRFNGGFVTTDSMEAVDRLPFALETVQPVVPNALRHVLGRVLVEFVVDEKGNVTSVKAKESTLAELTGPALEAAKQWKFQAAVKSGHPTVATVAVPFVFGN
jgi:TonB family protein